MTERIPDREPGLPAGSPLEPFDWHGHPDVAAAIQSCFQGTANADQQKLAIEGIVDHLCGYYDLSFRGSDRETSFAEGKRYVGAQIIKMTRLNHARLRQALAK